VLLRRALQGGYQILFAVYHEKTLKLVAIDAIISYVARIEKIM